jgi:hypothetical protein
MAVASIQPTPAGTRQQIADLAQGALREAYRRRRALLSELRQANHLIAELETHQLVVGIEPEDGR